MVLHNGFSLNTIKRRDGDGISEIYHMDISKLRSGKVDMRDFVKEYYYSADWRDTRRYKPVVLPEFDMSIEEPSQVYWYMGYDPNQTYYPMPDWIGGRVAVEIDINIKNFHLQNLQNGFYPSIFISMNNGIPSEEERTQIYRHLTERYSSTNNAGGMFLNFAEDKEHEQTITPL
jgi:capsid portal protein